jgi:hypothetical protein
MAAPSGAGTEDDVVEDDVVDDEVEDDEVDDDVDEDDVLEEPPGPHWGTMVQVPVGPSCRDVVAKIHPM